jgi:hypothetical protein
MNQFGQAEAFAQVVDVLEGLKLSFCSKLSVRVPISSNTYFWWRRMSSRTESAKSRTFLAASSRVIPPRGNVADEHAVVELEHLVEGNLLGGRHKSVAYGMHAGTGVVGDEPAKVGNHHAVVLIQQTSYVLFNNHFQKE